MKKNLLMIAGMMFAAVVSAQKSSVTYDSTKVERLQELVVNGVRAQNNAPFAMSKISKKSLNEFSKTGKELPFLFAQTPGVIAWSENGMGTGTTYMRMRGSGDSRINVTLDGVPLNSPEDQCVFWANMNSYASLLGSVQIQRGVGSSTNGDGAFGGTVALSSAAPMLRPSAEASFSYGSYNTINWGGYFSTGLLWNHLIIDGAFHQTTTDGYMHGTKGRSGSYYGGLTWMKENFQIRYKNIGNFERTGQAWNGVTAGNSDYSLMDGSYDDGSWSYNAKTGIKDYEDMRNVGLGKFNSLYEYLVTGQDGLFVKDANGNYLTARYQMNDGSYWDRTTDNFWQNHNILSASWNINDYWTTAASLHYTYGYGYYEEFRPQNKLEKFGLTATDGNGNKIKKTDFVRKKGLTQHTYGVVWNANYKRDSWDVVGGFSIQNFDGNHFGYLTYAANDVVRQKFLADGDYKYYDSDAHKFDASFYLKAAYKITEQWEVFADMQYRHVGFRTDGYNDKYYTDDNGNIQKHLLDINKKYDFFNPKAGFSWTLDGHRVYGSLALNHREPERNNFTDNGSYPAPKSESLLDYELGYTYNGKNWHVGANLYYMDYTDQFVQTGMVSDIGENLTTNIKDSYRMGIELQAGVAPTSWLTIEGNAALSKNKIKDFDEQVNVDWKDNVYKTIHYDNSTLAFSPSTILNGFINLHYKGWQAVWHTNFVSRQYLDNTECKDRSLAGYSVSDASVSYTLKPKKVMKEVVFGLNVNNVFNRHYAASGWVYSAILEEYGNHPNNNRYYQMGFIPMAGTTVMGNVTLRF
ncbi:MAG: TonB-dependent receptor plug domain-containing protein [Prevotella sp.]|nr:TonB-dependent receptor plug domain-containing protein [Prevotella sp.]MBR4379487.1 TonB-dependent receptor plug domain-containing protein [Prevotella sp.]